jgi:hypothetical protein
MASEQGSLKKHPRLKDRAALIATAFVCITVLLLFRWKVGHDAYIRWGGLVLTIAVVFGTLIRKSKEFYEMKSFWILVASSIALNIVIFGIILASASEWKLPWFGIMLLEIPIFFMFRNGLQSK